MNSVILNTSQAMMKVLPMFFILRIPCQYEFSDEYIFHTEDRLLHTLYSRPCDVMNFLMSTKQTIYSKGFPTFLIEFQTCVNSDRQHFSLKAFTFLIFTRLLTSMNPVMFSKSVMISKCFPTFFTEGFSPVSIFWC